MLPLGRIGGKLLYHIMQSLLDSRVIFFITLREAPDQGGDFLGKSRRLRLLQHQEHATHLIHFKGCCLQPCRFGRIIGVLFASTED